MEFAQLAQDFVDATSQLVGKRTINIMNTLGIIIATTEPERLGSFHQGAAEVISTGKAVLIHKEDLPRYPGAKEGYNMPILLEGKLLGVVGIFGEKDAVKEIANLLSVYVAQYFQQQALMQKQKLETEVRTQILRLLMYGEEKQMESILQLSGVISVQLLFPVKIFLYTVAHEKETGENFSHISQLEQVLIWQGLLDKRKDIYGILENHFVVLHGARECEQDSYSEKINYFIHEHGGYQLSISGLCENLTAIPRGIKEVFVLSSLREGEICDISQHEYKMKYLIQRMLSHGGSYYVEQMHDCLYRSQNIAGGDQMLITAGVYYEEGGSVTKASQRLHLHKNTLLYRMKRIFSLLGLEDEPSFIREFYIRLILEQYPHPLPKQL